MGWNQNYDGLKIMKLYIFDFDGTISNKDSFILFTYYSISFFQFIRYWVRILPLYIFRLKTNSELKEMFFLENFNKVDENRFQSICNNFVKDKLDRIIKNSFNSYIKKIASNSEIVIVSASIKNYLKPWCEKMGFDLISTELEVEDGKLTGKFSTLNCNRNEKVRRIKEKYSLLDKEEIHVFGNSKGDIPMMELGTHRYMNFFD
tara:strand:- start:446 stop:1057 length:612 start_codon:yes stop_codon:yes gene_type:complete